MRSLFILILIAQILTPLTFGRIFFNNYVGSILGKIFSGRQNSNNTNTGHDSESRNLSRILFSDLEKPRCDCSSENAIRIVNGREGHFVPWLVSLGYIYRNTMGDFAYEHLCGGTILNSEIILTAGHCLDYINRNLANNLVIRFGLVDLDEQMTRDNTIRCKDFIVHEKYVPDSGDYDNDIAIIKLGRPIDLENGKTRAACLDFANNYSPFLQVSDWGLTTPYNDQNETDATSPTRLLKLDLIEDKRESTPYIITAVGDVQNSDTCSGDSGSPLQSISPRTTSVIGLVSYGTANNEGVHCASNTGFVRLGAHSRFIQDTIGDSFCEI